MEMKRIEALAKLMEKAGLSHLELREGDNELVLARQALAPAETSPAMQASTVSVSQPASASAAFPIEQEKPDGDILTSPLVGCVYLASAPGQPPFVKEGGSVKKGQVLCIVEAMKVMNEFLAPRSGVISRICVENGQLAEYGQALFYLK